MKVFNSCNLKPTRDSKTKTYSAAPQSPDAVLERPNARRKHVDHTDRILFVHDTPRGLDPSIHRSSDPFPNHDRHSNRGIERKILTGEHLTIVSNFTGSLEL